MEKIIEEIRKEFLKNSDEAIKESSKRYFKEPIKVYGIKTSFGLKLAERYRDDIVSRSKKEVFALCEELFQSGYMEESFVACNWANYKVDEFLEEDFSILEGWISAYVSNWAECDTLCNHTVGDYLERYPGHVKNLHEWAHSENRWLRRASAVSLILPARKGNFLEDVFILSDILLLDKDDLVQKGYGWLLKEASKSHLEEVFGYVYRNKDKMPRTALRYAIEKMPDDYRKRAMEK